MRGTKQPNSPSLGCGRPTRIVPLLFFFSRLRRLVFSSSTPPSLCITITTTLLLMGLRARSTPTPHRVAHGRASAQTAQKWPDIA